MPFNGVRSRWLYVKQSVRQEEILSAWSLQLHATQCSSLRLTAYINIIIFVEGVVQVGDVGLPAVNLFDLLTMLDTVHAYYSNSFTFSASKDSHTCLQRGW